MLVSLSTVFLLGLTDSMSAMAIAFGVWTTEKIYDTIRDPGVGAAMLGASTFLSFGTNLFSTAAIAIRAW